MADLIAALSQLEGSDRIVLIDTLVGLWPKRGVGVRTKTFLHHIRDAGKRFASSGSEDAAERWTRTITAGWEHLDLPALDGQPELADFVRVSLSRLTPPVDVTHGDEYSSTVLLSYAAVSSGVDTRQTPFALCRDIKAAYDARIAAEDAVSKAAESADTVQRAHSRLTKHKARTNEERGVFLVWLAVTRKGSAFRVPEDIGWPSLEVGDSKLRVHVQLPEEVRCTVDAADGAYRAWRAAEDAFADASGKSAEADRWARYWQGVLDEGEATRARLQSNLAECQRALPGLQQRESEAQTRKNELAEASRAAQEKLERAKASLNRSLEVAENSLEDATRRETALGDEARALDGTIADFERQVADLENRIGQNEVEDAELGGHLEGVLAELAQARHSRGLANQGCTSAVKEKEAARLKITQAKRAIETDLPPIQRAADEAVRALRIGEETLQESIDQRTRNEERIASLGAEVARLNRDIPRAPEEAPRTAEAARVLNVLRQQRRQAADAAEEAAKQATEAMRVAREAQLNGLNTNAAKMQAWWAERVSQVLPISVELDRALAQTLFDLPTASVRALEEALWELGAAKDPLSLASAGTGFSGHAIGIRLDVPAPLSARDQLKEMSAPRGVWTEVYAHARESQPTQFKAVQLLAPIGRSISSEGTVTGLTIGVPVAKQIESGRAVWDKAPKPEPQTQQTPASGVGQAAAQGIPRSKKPMPKGVKIALIAVVSALVLSCGATQLWSALQDSGAIVVRDAQAEQEYWEQQVEEAASQAPSAVETDSEEPPADDSTSDAPAGSAALSTSESFAALSDLYEDALELDSLLASLAQRSRNGEPFGSTASRDAYLADCDVISTSAREALASTQNLGVAPEYEANKAQIVRMFELLTLRAGVFQEAAQAAYPLSAVDGEAAATAVFQSYWAPGTTQSKYAIEFDALVEPARPVW